MGEIVKRSVVLMASGEEAIFVRALMYLALSYDDRAVDRLSASAFLHRVPELLEAAGFEV
jgi:pyruvate dehydrogenase E2 component (dihydrolipoamide acetyltransferase)